MNTNSIPMYGLSESDKLNKWLKKRSTYAEGLLNTEQSTGYMSYFNDDYTPHKGFMSPYKDNDIDIKNTSIKRYHDDNFSSRTSDFYKDSEIIFMEGSNHCNVNYLYKIITEKMGSYENRIPTLTKNSKGVVNYSEKKISTRVDKVKFYKLIMNMSS
jgi:hypothetical protein